MLHVLHVLQFASVANCKRCKLQVLQITSVANISENTSWVWTHEGTRGLLELLLQLKSTYVHKLRKGKQIPGSFSCLNPFSYVCIAFSFLFYPNPFIPISDRLSLYSYLFIAILLSRSPNPIPLSLSLNPYPSIIIHLSEPLYSYT